LYNKLTVQCSKFTRGILICPKNHTIHLFKKTIIDKLVTNDDFKVSHSGGADVIVSTSRYVYVSLKYFFLFGAQTNVFSSELTKCAISLTLKPRLHESGQIFARTTKKENLHGSTLHLHGTGGTGRIFERLSVQVWDLLKGRSIKLYLTAKRHYSKTHLYDIRLHQQHSIKSIFCLLLYYTVH